MKNIEVRLAKVEDAQAIYDLILQSSDETDFMASNSKERLKEGFSKEKIENLLKSEFDKMFICFLGDIPIGTLGVHSMKRERFKHRASIGMNVLKKYWEMGGGSALLSSALEYFNSNEILTKLELEVRSDNIRAINLYKKFGFKKEGDISQYFCIESKFYSAYIMGLEKHHSSISF